MTIHFQRELTLLRKLALGVGAAVEEAIAGSIDALLNNDEKKAAAVLQGDDRIDRMEIEVEEECLKILALYQPVAQDLRFIISVLKMNNDLERIGDHACNIAKRARFLARHELRQPWPRAMESMAANTRTMVKKSLDALITSDPALARSVFESDDEVDAQKREVMDELRQRLNEPHPPEQTIVLLKMMDAPRHLERIADLASNIAEDILYLTEGEIARHRHEES